MNQNRRTNRSTLPDTPHAALDSDSPSGSQSKHRLSSEQPLVSRKHTRIRFWVSLFVAAPIFFLSPTTEVTLPFQWLFPGSDWLVLMLATVLYIIGGYPFLTGAKEEIVHRAPGMRTLIALGISVAYFYSVYSFLMNHFNPVRYTDDFFWEQATLTIIMLLGQSLVLKARTNAGDALKEMAALLPETAYRISKEEVEQIPLSEIQLEDHLLIHPGAKIPADGRIVKGNTSVDESMVTGESQLVARQKGEQVIGGSINGGGSVEIEVTGTNKTGYLAQMMAMVEQAQAEKSTLESLSDKVARGLFYLALLAGLSALILWQILTGDTSTAFERMVSVLIIACPHALGLAIPLVIVRSTSIAARHGLLIRNRLALEQGHALRYVLLAKTGTLTQGSFTVVGITPLTPDYTEDEILKYLGALEEQRDHPLAMGIMDYLDNSNIQPHHAELQQNLSGVGVIGMVNGLEVQIINEKELKRLSLSVDPAIQKDYVKQGCTLSYLIIEGCPVAVVALGDVIKPQARPFIDQLKKQHIIPVMLTEDNQAAAQATADYLGIEQCFGELLPQEKAQLVKNYLDSGEGVMMVGDGINDAQSLATANVGIAIGSGTNVAIESADVVLIDSDPLDIIKFLDLTKQTRKKMIQNLWWGAGYNIVAIPLAAGILAPMGILLNPALAALLTSCSTMIVAYNAMTLRIKGE